jgi:hypothetical protein
MPDFLHSWRRKVGVVTLVMACVAMGLWSRSLITQDILNVLDCRLSSRNGWFVWCTSSMYQHDELVEWQEDLVGADEDYYLPSDPEVDWDFRAPGFGLGWLPNNGHGRAYIRIISLWYFIVPLTLLSVYLILWKPRKRA